ncbi:MAG: thiolase family protein [Acidimicrobiia bacterium]
MARSTKKNRVAIVGVGYSQVGRKSGLTDRQHTTQCVKAALDDAGLKASDIDGYATVGGEPLSDAHMLGIGPMTWFFSGMISPAYSHAALMAVAAIEAGHAETVVTTRIMMQQPSGAARLAAPTGPVPGTPGDYQYVVPIGGGIPTQWAGLNTRRYMEYSGATEDHFAQHVVTQRYHASMNPEAIFRDPITKDDYFASRYVSKPLRLLDCDYPVDSGSAVIYTTEERARDLKQRPVFVEASALSMINDLRFEVLEDQAVAAPKHCADVLWSRTDLKPKDVSCAQLYDGFTYITFQWLEAFGFCEPGGAGPFIAEGNTRLGGSLPLNTDGGACNVGRRHGANFCIESVRQLRGGQSGPRQVENATSAVWSNGAGPFGGAMLLTN